MSIRRALTLTCDGIILPVEPQEGWNVFNAKRCQTSFSDPDEIQEPKPIRKAAARAGWQAPSRNGFDYCPKCQAAIERAKAPKP